jgi:four helix bundle protein
MEKNDLRVRTKQFAGAIVRLFVALPRGREEVLVIGRQLLRAGTSVAANYREASRARSPADFLAKIGSCTQEADETQMWLELLRDDCGVKNRSIEAIWQESDELISIFVTMSRRTKNRDKSGE